MEFELKHRPSYSLAVIKLDPDERVQVEPGSMVSYSDGVHTKTQMKGGLFGGLKRMFVGESFFVTMWEAPSKGGEVTVSTSFPGDMQMIEINGDFRLQSGAFVAGEEQLEFDAAWGGARGFFSSGNLVLLKVSGTGKLLVGCYGAVEEIFLNPGEKYNINTGHIIGFDESVKFKIRKAGSWSTTFFGNEGLVCELEGPGRVLMQTRSEEAFMHWILPPVLAAVAHQQNNRRQNPSPERQAPSPPKDKA